MLPNACSRHSKLPSRQSERRLESGLKGAATALPDALLAPTAPSVAFPAGQISDPVEMYQQDVFTVPASLAGVPALAIPCGFHEHLPVGMQLIGPHFSESALLAIGADYQRATDWHRRIPTSLQ